MNTRISPFRLAARLPLALALLLAGAGVARAAPDAMPALPQLTQQLQAIVQDPVLPLPGLSVVALHAGQVVYAAQFGARRIDANGRQLAPVDQHTLYRIASISKMVTALGVMKLVEQGRLSLDADISDYLGYRLRNPHFPQQALTLRMLLSHTSSLRDGAGYSWEPQVALRDVLVPGGALYANGAAWSPEAAPGAYFSYVNLNWGVIASVMESATGERFDRLMRRLILDPLEVRGGFYVPELAPADAQELATLYRKRSANPPEVWDPAGPWIAQTDDFGGHVPPPHQGVDSYVPGRNGTVFAPQGGLRISAAGLTAIMQMMIAHGRYRGRTILEPATLAAMQAPQWDWHGSGDTDHGLFRSWGLGLQRFGDVSDLPAPGAQGTPSGDRLVEGGGFKAVGHLGDAWGLKAAFVFDPASGNGMITIAGGAGADPDIQPGRYSSLTRLEERILSTLYLHALAPLR